MPEKRESSAGVYGAVPRGPRDKAKAILPESQSPVVTNDSQNRVGVSHRAYLDGLVVRPPVSLCRVDGSPVLGLLRRLRRRGTRVR